MPHAASLLVLAALAGGHGPLRPAAALDNGVARTPPMGWNSWGHFRGATSAELLMRMADELVALGLRDAGYEYVNTDDLWLELERSAEGRLVPGERFGGPGEEGMRNLSAYIHGKGLKFGVYGAAGETSPGRHCHSILKIVTG
jgi:alpha-galactosidase